MYTLSISLEEEMCELLINVLFSKGYVRWIFGVVVKHRENSAGMTNMLTNMLATRK